MVRTPRSGRAAAAALSMGSLGWLFVGIAHPTVHRGDIPRHIERLSSSLAGIHIVAIVAVAALFFGLASFSLRRGIRRNAVLAALVVAAIATISVIVAGAIDGFIIPGVVAAASSTARRPMTFALLSVCGVAIQTFTKIGFAAYAAAIALWSADLLRDRGALRAVGILGCAAAAATGALLIGTPHIGPHELLAIGLFQVCWYVSVAGLLARDRI